MVISQKSQESNRKNAQHSTGPKTPEGKKAASLNAVPYGLRTRNLIITGENIADYWQLWDGLETEWQPETPTEHLYLEQMSTSQWLLARMARSEHRVYEANRKNANTHPSSVTMECCSKSGNEQVKGSFRKRINTSSVSSSDQATKMSVCRQPTAQPPRYA